MAAYLLHKVKVVLRNNRLMGILDDKPVLFRIFIQLLVFVGLAVGLEVDRVTEVIHTLKNMNDRCHTPAFCFNILSAYTHTLRTVICRRCRYAVRCQDIGDLSRTVALNAELKYSPYHSGSFFVNDPLVLIRFGLLVAVRRVRGKRLACLSLCFLDGTNFLACITSVPVIKNIFESHQLIFGF